MKVPVNTKWRIARNPSADNPLSPPQRKIRKRRVSKILRQQAKKEVQQ